MNAYLDLLAQAVQGGLELVDLLLEAPHGADLALEERRLQSTINTGQRILSSSRRKCPLVCIGNRSSLAMQLCLFIQCIAEGLSYILQCISNKI